MKASESGCRIEGTINTTFHNTDDSKTDESSRAAVQPQARRQASASFADLRYSTEYRVKGDQFHHTFVRSLGLGYSALENFRLNTNCPRPMTKKCYKSTFSKIHAASKEVAEESMVRAAEEVKTLGGKENSDGEN
ncbi:hypothetical protein ElyMa_005762200 [Elysia marginata]|uniref:Uncharacterized protein n=1 Tax=Elysia marginata TaxID=1093978 RepID=A0AAV4FR89_9GAST|nr:hypothetical protein ElyMa_005762200 [Elysia marginata]